MIVGAAALHLVLGMAIFSALEAHFAAHPARRWWRRRFLVDALLWLVHPLTYALGVAVAAALAAALPRPAFAAAVAALPAWSQIAIAVVGADLVGYALHRAYHRVPLLWAFHVVHHTSEELDWLSSSRLHPVSQAINASVVAAPLMLCGLPTNAVVAANAVVGLWAVIAHANLRMTLPGSAPLGFLLVTPAFHRHHHGRSVGARNLGGMFSLWDRLFGTWENPAALPCGTLEHVDDGVMGLLVEPFVRRDQGRAHAGIAHDNAGA